MTVHGCLTAPCRVCHPEAFREQAPPAVNLGGLHDAPGATVERALSDAMDEIHRMMMGRHRKYGANNISRHGTLGILVRMDDKFSRLQSGHKNYDDETVESTLDDIIGYALIWKLWLREQWPGSSDTM